MYFPQTANKQYSLITPKHSSVVSPRLAWMMYYKEVWNVKKVCEKFGISRKTFYKWWNKYFNSNYEPKNLLDSSKRPHKSPMATPHHIIQKVIDAKAITGFGQRRLKAYLANNFNINLSEHTIWKLLKKHSNNKNLSIKSPGDQIYISTISLFNKHGKSAVVYTAIDEATQMRISKAYKNLSINNTTDFLKLIIERYPFKIRRVNTPDKIVFKSIRLESAIETILVEQPSELLKRSDIEQNFYTDKSDNNLVPELTDMTIEDYMDIEFEEVEDLNVFFEEYLSKFNNHQKNTNLLGLTPLQKLRSFEGFQQINYFDMTI